MGAATVSATTWRWRRDRCTLTCTVGGVTCGYWAKGRFRIASPPANVITIDSTVAKIGRSMKNRENMAGGRLQRQGLGKNFPLHPDGPGSSRSDNGQVLLNDPQV